MMAENRRRYEEYQKSLLRESDEPTVVEPGDSFSLRQNLREYLAKADQLYGSTKLMQAKIGQCQTRLKQMRNTLVAARPGAPGVRALPTRPQPVGRMLRVGVD